jgi:cytochrome c
VKLRTVQNNKNNARNRKGYDLAWASAAKEIASQNLSGLQVRCPFCHRNGTAISKWEQGKSIVTLYPPEVGNVSIYSFLFTIASIATSIHSMN